jgi:predicted NBD/HSP70 family sugar kinase
LIDTSINIPKRTRHEIQILSLIRESGGMSRVQLAAQLGLHLPALTLLAGSLIKEGLIREEGLASSTGGRPGILLRLNPLAACFLGVEIGLNFVRTLCVDLSGTVLNRTQEYVEGIEPKALYKLVERQAAAAVKRSSGRLKGVGVAVAGMVDRSRGKVLNTNIVAGRQELDLEAGLKKLFPSLPLVLHNDANAAALGEHWYGAARQVQNFFWVYLGSGTGMGIVSKGDLYLGGHGIAGELGFSIMGENGEYFTKLASGEVLANLAAPKLKSKGYAVQMEAVARGLAQGDKEALAAAGKIGRRLGMGIAGMVNLFDPSEVYLGGPLLALGGPLLEPMQKGFTDRLLLPKLYTLQNSVLGEEAVAQGAAALVIHEFLSSERIPKKRNKKKK